MAHVGTPRLHARWAIVWLALAAGCGADAVPNGSSVHASGGAAGAVATGGGGSGATAGTGGCNYPIGGQPPTCADGTLSYYYSNCDFGSTKCSGDTPVCTGPTGSGQCSPCPDPIMVSVGNSCVDPTEVTRADYAAWLATAPSTAGQSPECAFNAALDPDPACMASPEVCQSDCAEHPQVCVDWCDALAFCAAHGKRLCGPYPPNPQNGLWMPDSVWANDDASELREACEGGTGHAYPYGSSYEPTTCNTLDAALGTTVPVASRPSCSFLHSDGRIFDTSGNVAEWENACDPASDVCRTRGGSFNDGAASATCQSVTKTRKRSELAPDLGFRCCGP